MELTVIIPTFNPDAGRLERTLGGLRAQNLANDRWEIVVIDNASTPPLSPSWPGSSELPASRVVREERAGLAHARQRGFAEARGAIAVLVDDDNVLAPDYLASVLEIFFREPRVGVIGGKSIGEFETTAPAWTVEFHPLLALRDLGDRPIISRGLRPSAGPINEYPAFAPIGAGMALRRSAWEAWSKARATAPGPSDRRGADLSSGGDNDIVLCALRAGWEVGYFPELSLTHLIPPQRLEPGYLARLNRGIQKSWMRVLRLHDANPWPPLSRLGATLRKCKAWFGHRPWNSPAARIRWQGACGHFEGRVGEDRP